eukprot:328394-Alexandrium_andersonii.AAC.1
MAPMRGVHMSSELDPLPDTKANETHSFRHDLPAKHTKSTINNNVALASAKPERRKSLDFS